MRSGNVVPLLYPFDLDGVFDDCPYDVINDHLRCWNSIDEKVVGVSVTTPIFSDGVVDYHPRERGPGFLMCGVPMHMHSKLGMLIISITVALCITQNSLEWVQIASNTRTYLHRPLV